MGFEGGLEAFEVFKSFRGFEGGGVPSTFALHPKELRLGNHRSKTPRAWSESCRTAPRTTREYQTRVVNGGSGGVWGLGFRI